ncbi:MAG: hypothetical protein V3S51_07065 [Dehalococcoidia bacterium]
MEIPIPSSQTGEESSDQELLLQQSQVKTSEDAFRTLLVKVATATAFLVSSLIVFYLLPFYPSPMALFLAIVVTIIAYRWSAVALLIMLLFAAPAYSYQLGGVLWALGTLAAIALALPFCVSNLPGAALGSAVGAAAGVLMLTPYFLFSLPLLAVTAMLRLRGSAIGAPWGIFMYLTFYLPFLFLVQPTAAEGETIPLFLSVDYPSQEALSHINLDSLKTAFQGNLNSGISGFPGASAYFVERWGGIALILSMLVAFVGIPAILNPPGRIRENRVILRGLSLLLLMLAIELVFLVPLQLLGKPLGYHTGLDGWSNVASLTGLMVAVGSVGFAAETWLCRRNLKVKLGSDLAMLSEGLRDLLENTRKLLDQVASACHDRDLVDEKATIVQCEEKVALTLESVRALGLPRLELSWNEFSNMRPQLSNLQLQLETKLLSHLEDSRRTYKTMVGGAIALGIAIDQDLLQAQMPSPEELDFDDAVAEQQILNSAFEELAGKLVEAGDILADTVKEEFDPEFSLATIDISHGFLDQGRYEDAARTILEDLQIIDGRIEASIVELAGKVTAMANNFKDVVTSRLVPAFESTGDSDSLAKCYHTADELEAVAKSVHNSGALADLIGIVDQSRRLADLATKTVDELKHKISSIEGDNDRRCPPRYNWGRNSHTDGDVQQLLDSTITTSYRLTLSSRFSVIERAVQAVEHQARITKHYSQVNELLINYPNVQQTIEVKMRASEVVDISELPVRPKYAVEYLKMYAAENHDDVAFDPKSGTLRFKTGKGTS